MQRCRVTDIKQNLKNPQAGFLHFFFFAAAAARNFLMSKLLELYNHTNHQVAAHNIWETS
jgi:hypothetical protein